jgi:hypothetical protein
MGLSLQDGRIDGNIRQWVTDIIIPEGNQWEKIINHPEVTDWWVYSELESKKADARPRRLPNSAYRAEFVSDFLKTLEWEGGVGGKRKLIIICEKPDNITAEEVGRQIQEDEETESL